ncbi:enhancer of mRNA-decapping protein 3-like [Dunckerocampus dactyliophorus]|uniref:enhancer of mRNA-decapping protein 3-like n=1 Tax=Dunckerocampus dactyliophorus TaxID=161453 RepID=UPI002406F4E2|nr:enhancer of mRNA-decapping protein 3-like [Dunckerocampus dactyliophorus]
MAADWLGSLMSINCGPTLGVYQGEVSSVDQSCQTISLRQPFHNGVKCPVPEVTFSAIDIKELKILDIRNGSNQNSFLVSTSANSTPVAVPKGDPRTVDAVNSPQHFSKSYGERHLDVPKGFRRKHNSWSSSSRTANQVTPKKNGVKNGCSQMKQRDDECFGDGMDGGLDADFDFEGNLALFDKAAVFSEIDTSERRNGVRSRGTPQEQTPSRYRHDENILEGKPVVYRQITVPQPGAKEYCTDLPDTPVDLIINCLDCHENTFLMDQPWYRAAADWANQNRAPVLSIDPPVSGRGPAVEAKWSLSLCLPLHLAEGAGRVYLRDIGIPRQVFQEVGIKYHSPFGCKFVIPLHSA